MSGWYGLVGHEVIGPFDTMDPWYHQHAGPEWRHKVRTETGVDPWLVGRDEIPGHGQSVSTVFLGLDHQWEPDGPPMLFETMVFPECEVMWRHSTWADAEEAHREVVALGEFLSAIPEVTEGGMEGPQEGENLGGMS